MIWRIRVGIAGAALALAGCASAVAVTPVPTLTLIPPTATFVPTPIVPTVTRTGLSRPADLVTPTPESESLSIPAVAQPLLQRALDDLAEQLGIESNSVQIVRVERAVWTSIDLGCGEETTAAIQNVEIDGYRFVLEAEGETYEYHADTRGSIRLCGNPEMMSGRIETLLLDADPVAADMVSLAQRRLADQLDLAAVRIRVVDVMPISWTDSSLGCPQPDQTYVPISIDGYRIVLAAGDEEYIFHSDSTQVRECPAAREQLPVAE